MEGICKVENLNEQAYRRIMTAIINNDLPPGSRVVEAKIAAILGISRTPVREAIKRLIDEGLIITKQGNVKFVLDVTRKDIDEIYDTRLMIEKFALNKIVDTLNHEQIRELEKILERYNDCDRERRKEVFIDVDEQFHAQIVAYTGNQRLINFFKIITNQMKVFRHLSFEHQERIDLAMERHFKYLKAIKDRDLKTASELLDKHLESGRAEAFADLNIQRNKKLHEER